GRSRPVATGGDERARGRRESLHRRVAPPVVFLMQAEAGDGLLQIFVAAPFDRGLERGPVPFPGERDRAVDDPVRIRYGLARLPAGREPGHLAIRAGGIVAAVPERGLLHGRVEGGAHRTPTRREIEAVAIPIGAAGDRARVRRGGVDPAGWADEGRRVAELEHL